MCHQNPVQNHAAPTAGMRTLYLNMKKLKFDVAQHVSIVGQRVGSNDEFVKIVQDK